MLVTILASVASYIVGSIPFGYLAGKILRGVDVREHGSGNVGATNVLRVLGPVAGVAVLIIDAGKGVLSVLVVAGIAKHLGCPVRVCVLKALCGAAAISGHDWPIFLRFHGGKGVATGLGVFLALGPLLVIPPLLLFLSAVFLTRHISVGSLVLAASVPLITLIAGRPAAYAGLGLFWFLTVLYSHRENIRRLLHGAESRIGNRIQVPGDDQ